MATSCPFCQTPCSADDETCRGCGKPLPPPPGSAGQGSGPQGSPKGSSLVTPKRLAVVGGAAVALVLVGGVAAFSLGGGGIRTDDGEISNATDFLSEVQGEWHQDLPSDNVELSDDPSCYYVLDGEDDATGTIACGGARRAGVGDGQVWDTYSFTTTAGTDGEQAATEPSADEESVTRPEGRLVSAEGDEAAESIDALAAPPLPEADAGLVSTDTEGLDLSDLTVEDAVEPGDAGKVITPAGTFTVASVATTPSVVVDEVPHQPAEGEEFWVVETGFEPDADVTSFTDQQPLSVAVKSGDQQTEVLSLEWRDEAYRAYGDLYSDPLVLSAPEGSQLVISSAGHDQVVDLATGERQPDEVADSYYRDSAQDLNERLEYPAQKVTNYGKTSTLAPRVSVEHAELTPYDPERGWAKAGKAWLQVDFTGTVDDGGYSVADDDKSTITWKATGNGFTGQTRMDEFGSSDDEGETAVFEVPADSTAVTLQATPRLWTSGGLVENTRWVDYAPQSVKVSLPQ